MSKIFFSSDLHFCHDRDFIYKARGYYSITEHNLSIAAKFYDVVGKEDDLYLLGDHFLCNDDIGMEFMSRLPGRLHLLWGNHDTKNRIAKMKWLPNVVEILGYAAPLRYGKYSFMLSHYPMQTTNFSDKGIKTMTLNLCGHTHQKEIWDENSPWSYHVEVDAHEGYPVYIENIIRDFKKKWNIMRES